MNVVNVLKWALQALVAVVIVIVGFTLVGVADGLALLVYVLVVVVLVAAWLLGRLRGALPVSADFPRLLAGRACRETRPGQLETVRRRLDLAGASRSDLLQLRPIVHDIAATRLARRHGVDLEQEPTRARAVLGDGRTWELLHADPSTPRDRDVPGWSRAELERLVEELENI